MAGRGGTIRDLLALVVAVTLVGAVVVGVAGSDRSADAATTTTHRVTIPAAAFHAGADLQPYGDNGGNLFGQGVFLAPVPFHRPGDKVRVMNMTMTVTDNHADMICASLRVVSSAAVTSLKGNDLCSTGAAPQPRSFKMRFPPPRAITEFQGPFVLLFIDADAPDDLRFHAVRITYRVTQ